MTTPPCNTKLVAAFIMGLGPYFVLPANAADSYQPGDPAQHEIERGDTRVTSGKHDLYGTD